MDANILIILIIFMTIILLLTIFVFVISSGLLHDINIGAGKPPISNVKVFYKSGEGTFKDVAPIFCDITSISPKNKSFAIYYDNPSKVGTRERWAVGVVLAENLEEPDSALVETFTQQGYKPFTFPRVENVVKTTFPYASTISALVGSYRVYPQLEYYVKERKLCAHPWIEIYDGDLIQYMVPLAKQEEFYVPEFTKSKAAEASAKKLKRRKRALEREERDNRDISECSDLEPNGNVNIECIPVIECEHSYATQHKQEMPVGTETRQGPEAPMNSAGESIQTESVVKELHNTRSKSVNMFAQKTDKLVNVANNSKHRSASAAPGAKLHEKIAIPLLMCSQAGGDNEETKFNHNMDVFGRDTGNYSMDGSYDINSSASSVSSSGETVESSVLSSEYSYSSVGSNTSHCTSRYSCDSDKTF